MDTLSKINVGPQISNFEYSKVEGFSKAKKKNFTPEEKKKIAENARQFEAFFMYLVFKGLRKAMLSEFSDTKDEANSFGEDILSDITLMEVTNYIAKNGVGTGIANKIYQELTGEKLKYLDTLPPIHKNEPKEIRQKEEPKSLQIINPLYQRNNSSTLFERISKYEDIIQDTAKKYNLSPQLLKSVIAVESGGNHRAVSPAGAKGLMQLIDSTARYLGVQNVFNPEENIEGGAKYLREMLDTFDGNLDYALAAYNAGPGNVLKYNGIPPFKETKSYVAKVKYYLSYFKNFED